MPILAEENCSQTTPTNWPPVEAMRQFLPLDSHFTVALSGGSDSVAALLAGVELGLNLEAVHVQHGNELYQKKMAEFCQELCERYSVPFKLSQIQVPQKGNWEASARKLRYQALAENSRDRVLITGHHLDDQIETFWLKVLRGAGLRGLCCMQMFANNPENRDQLLVRPFLHLSKLQLETFVTVQGETWIEDPTNCDTSLQRNFLRHEFLPELEKKYPDYRQSVAAAIQSLQADRAALMHSLPPTAVTLQQVQTWTPQQLSAWVMNCFAEHGSGTPPSQAQINEFVRQLKFSASRNNANYEIACGNLSIRRNGKFLELRKNT
jgi:tRNA(Ile)-lysidine synthase